MTTQPAYVLHHWAWSESSLIVDLFTRGQGRIAAVAKGAKRPYSQLRSVLLPFQRIAVVLGRPRPGGDGEILPLRSAEYAGGTPVLGADRLFAGFYLNELLLRLLARHDAHERLFDAYGDALAALALADATGSQAVLRAFELQLLRETGVLPQLDRGTATQEPLHPQARYALRGEAGLVQADAGEPAIAAADGVALEQALQSGDPSALRAVCAGCLPVLRHQLRSLLHYHLGSSHLRTREAMAEVNQLLEPEARA